MNDKRPDRNPDSVYKRDGFPLIIDWETIEYHEVDDTEYRFWYNDKVDPSKWYINYEMLRLEDDKRENERTEKIKDAIKTIHDMVFHGNYGRETDMGDTSFDEFFFDVMDILKDLDV